MKPLIGTLAVLAVFLVGAGTAHASVISKPANNLGLIAYWSFNEGTGTKAGDFSGNRNTGTLSGSTLPTWVNGKLGKALSFDGGSGYVSVGTLTGLLSTLNSGSITFSAWISTTYTASIKDIFGGINTGTNSLLKITLNRGKNDNYAAGKTQAALRQEGGLALIAEISTNIYDGNWHHLVVHFKPSTNTFNFYVDGVLVSSTNSSANTLNNFANFGVAIPIGASNNRGTVEGFFPGKLDEVRVYNRALSASDVAALYRSGQVTIKASLATTTINASVLKLQAGSTLTQGLVGHWTFDGPDITDKVYDRSGQGNNGYFIGGATSSAKTIGKLGQALRFNGSSNYVNGGNPSSLNVSGIITMSAWVKKTADKQQVIIRKKEGSSVGYVLDINSSGKFGIITEANDVDDTRSNTTLTNNQWS